MIWETMTPNERLWSAIRLERPDRVPIVPMLCPEPAARLNGLPLAAVARDGRLAVDAAFRVFDEYGGWENPYPAVYTPVGMQIANVFPMRMRIPGKDLGENDVYQVEEQEILKPHDYDRIAEVGTDPFYYQDYLWRITDVRREGLAEAVETFVGAYEYFIAECTRRDTRPFFGGYALHPFFMLSLMRSLVPFTQDLYYNPEPVERALRRMTADVIAKQIPIIKQSGLKMWVLIEERASGALYPPAIAERFWWPYTRQIIDACWSEGIVTVFHLDQCWDKNLAQFRQLPRGSAVLELDSTTNIFAAKEAVGGHLCLHGDVPAALLSIGTPENVSAYCRRLIDEVGGDGGFILGSGCSVPADVRPENFAALIETGKTYAPSQR
jgi:uroporphyrinogen-III decarboxylase